MNAYGAVLDDFGLETMLDKLMEDFIRPMSKSIKYVLISTELKQNDLIWSINWIICFLNSF